MDSINDDEVTPKNKNARPEAEQDISATEGNATGPDDEQKEKLPKKYKFHWFFWIVVVVLVCGIVVGFYYPSFYSDAYEYARYMAGKVTGKEPLPLSMVKKETMADNAVAADILSNLEKAGKTSESVNNEKLLKDDSVEDDEEIEEEEADAILADDKQGIKTSHAQLKQEKTEQMLGINSEELVNMKTTLSVIQEQLKTQGEIALLVKSAVDLRKAAMSGKDFTNELEAMGKVSNVNIAIEKNLATLAIFTKGIKSKNTLQNEFEPLVKKAITSPCINENADFWDETIASLKTMIIVRKTDGSDGGITGTLTLAEKAVKAGKPDEAVNILNNLPAIQRMIFVKWCDDVVARQKVIQATADIVDEVIILMMNSAPTPKLSKQIEPAKTKVTTNDIKEGE